MAQQDWEPTARAEVAYLNALRRINRMMEQAIRDIKDPAEMAAALQRITGVPEYAAYCEAVARRMITMTAREQARTWREAAAQSSRGRELYRALRSQANHTQMGATVRERIRDNARLIKSLDREYAATVTQYTAREAQRGRRADEIAEDIRARFPDLAETRASLIARTETGKAATALVEAQAADLGLDWYIWRTSRDARVRPSHDRMDGVLVSWRDPPAPESMAGDRASPGPYHAGNIYNCRCYPEPVTDPEHLAWPMKVHVSGSILSMTYAQFARKAA